MKTKKEYPITEKFLLSLGFEREDVSAEESGDTSYYYYFVYNLKNERAFLISCANYECANYYVNYDNDIDSNVECYNKELNYVIEFFNEEVGYIDNANVLESLVNVLKCLKND